MPPAFPQPDVFDAALAKRIPDLTDTENPRLPDRAPAPLRWKLILKASMFIISTGISRATTGCCRTEGRCNYIPLNLGESVPVITGALSTRPIF